MVRRSSNVARAFRDAAVGAWLLALSATLVGCDGSLTPMRGDLDAGDTDAEQADDGGDATPDSGAPDARSDASPPDAALDAAADSGSDTGPGDAGPGPDAGPPVPRPLPDMSAMVDELAAERPDLLAGSCLEMGGDNAFLFELVRRLRRVDDRWGLNWKRGVVGDMSQDVVDYHFGHDTREGSTEVYIIDVISGHCGPSPGPTWIDQTEATRAAGTIGRWTLAGRTDL